MQRANSAPAPTRVEYAVRPVLRFITTRWSDTEGSEVIGEFPTAHQAQNVAFGLTQREHAPEVSARGVWGALDEEFEALLKSIDERDAANHQLQIEAALAVRKSQS